MDRPAVVLFLGLVYAGAVAAQVEQLATSGDGSVLLFHSRFRLQSETDLGQLGKIYRWQDGEWARLAAAQDIGFAISPPDVFSPFISTDGKIAGWQINIGCGLCQIIVVPPFSSEVSGVTLPAAFPRGTLRMSGNGRYFTGDSYPFSGAKYLDAATGAIADVPVDVYAIPVVREVANDGTALLLITAPRDPSQFKAPGTLSLWKPGSDSRPIYSENRVQGATISASGRRVAFEAIVEGGPDDDQRTLIVIDAETGELLSIAAMPPRDYRAVFGSFAKPAWDASGTQLIYRMFDDQGQPTAISLWEAATRESRVVLASAEGFAEAVISGDGRIIWAVTNSNRVLRLDRESGVTDEILAPLGSITRGVEGEGVPGSALLVRGRGFTKTQTAVDGDVQLPLVDATNEGLWVQIPWEYAASTGGAHTMMVRADGNPFEAPVRFGLTPGIAPHIATWLDAASGMFYAKAVHQDYGSLVVPENPAHRGEIVHVYMTGLGPLDQPLPTGAAGPVSPLARPLAPVTCSLGRRDGPAIGVRDVVYAPTLIGIYQADVVVPDVAPEGSSTLFCGTTDARGNPLVDGAPLSTTSAR